MSQESVPFKPVGPATCRTTNAKTDKAPAQSFYASASTPTQTSSLSFSTHQAASRFDPRAPGAIVMKRPDAAHDRAFNPHGRPVVDVVVDPAVGRHLRPHQVEGVKFLYECVLGMRDASCQGAILADEMGLGKTLQTIALVHTLLKQSPYWSPVTAAVQKVMVVCPLTLVKNWKREFHKWLGSSSINVLCVDGSRNGSVQRFVNSKVYQVMVIGYDKLRSCIELIKDARPAIDLIVCDEGHRLKSRDAKTTKMFNLLPTRKRILLSGTPIQNDLSEFHAMVDFVAPSVLGDYATFKRVFEDCIVQGRAIGCTIAEAEAGRERSDMLRRATQQIILHRSADILSGYLPPRTDMVVFCAPSSAQLQIYAAVVAQADRLANPLLLIGLLRKLCGSTRLLKSELKSEESSRLPEAARALLRSRIPVDQTSGKLALLQRILKCLWSQTEDKVVIVSHFVSALDLLEGLLHKLGYSCVRLDGQTRQEERQTIVQHFNSSPRSSSFVFLLSAKSGGTGLNLIGANRLILLDSDWNPSTDAQAMARIHRDGQHKPCFVYRLLLTGTMDEKIYQRQVAKSGLSETLMHASSSASAFTAEDLRDLFTLHTSSPCLTHAQLGCPCNGEGTDVRDEEVGTSREAEDFVPASQRPPDLVCSASCARWIHPAIFASSHRLLLQNATPNTELDSLFSWTHIDCTRAKGRLDDGLLEHLVDSPLEGEFDLNAVPVGRILHVFHKRNSPLSVR